MHVLFSTPSYWPSTAFGGPISKTRELARGLIARGHTVEVVTTSLVDLSTRPPRTTRTELVDGATVHYLGTPVRYRWMGVTPSIRSRLKELPRPDVVHVFGFRDFVGTATAGWAHQQSIPYVFEGLGMMRPKFRKVAVKQALDSTVYRGVPRQAALIVVASERERGEVAASGVGAARIVVRPNGFPPLSEPAERPGPLRRHLGLDAVTPLLLSLGRVAPGKGIDLLVRSLPALEETQFAVVGPDERGTTAELARLARELGVADRVQLTGPWRDPDTLLALYGDADVFALASEYESFGTAAAEAAAAGVVPLVTDRCGIADLLGNGAGVVVPYDQEALRSALHDLLADASLRTRLASGARTVAGAWSWPRVASSRRGFTGAPSGVRVRMVDLAIFGQDPGYAGGIMAQTETFWEAALALGRTPELHYLRHRRLDEPRRRATLKGRAVAPTIPGLDVVNLLMSGAVASRHARGTRTQFVCAATASSGFGAVLTRKPYGCWVSTTVAAEGEARRGGLGAARRIAHAASAPGLRLVERATLRGARVRWTISPASQRAAARASGLAESEFRVVPIPIATDRFTPAPDEEWERGLEVPELVFTGRADDPRKNIDLLLDGFELLRSRLPAATLTLVGAPPSRPLPAGVTALGAVPSVADVIRRAQLFVPPSLQEGFGIVVAEALASGVPVLVTPSGGPEELVRASQGGEVLAGFAPEELADRAFALLADVGRLTEMRRLGRAYVVREHHPSVLQAALAEALEVLDDGG